MARFNSCSFFFNCAKSSFLVHLTHGKMLFVGLSIGEARQNSAQSSNEEREVFCLVVAFPLSGSEVGKKSSGIER